jgi:RecA-family ATPase
MAKVKILNDNGKENAENKENNSLTINELNKDFDKLNSSVGLFKIQTANDWIAEARNKPPQKMLFDVFWFEDELCILFADTNLGKSIKAVQIGESISRGEAINGFRIETQPQNVLYFDFELTERQFRNRYTSECEPITEYKFSENFIRAEINIDAEIPAVFNDFETYLSHSLELAIVRYKSKVLIIDNCQVSQGC